MALNSSSTSTRPRNAGPSWGYAFLRCADRWLPAWCFNLLLRLGTWVAVATMPQERANSRHYLRELFGRRATRWEVWRHFFAFARMFILRLRVAEGRAHRCRPMPGCDDFMALMASGRPALLGTFHFGNSDLLGFFLKEFHREIFMIRLRMGNSADVDHLAARFAPWVKFIWVNETENLLFALKNAAQSGGSIALKADRPEHSAKLEAFDFLGSRRMFPVTIYHLALLFRRPVVFCVSVPGADDESLLYASPVFEPDDDSKAANLERAHVHFQTFLTQVEILLRAHPFLWFNFTPLNPLAPPALVPRPRSVTLRSASMLKRIYFVSVYAASWIVFGALTLGFNIGAVLLFVLLGREGCAPYVRAGLRRFLALWIGWLQFTGLIRVRWEGISEHDLGTGPRVWVANHPGLLDAVFLLSRVPNLVCVFKRAMVRNPFFGPAAWLGGHPRCGTGPDFVREAVRKIAAGHSMLIFPEGTRTSTDAVLNPLLPGFALIAARARMPVQLVVIESSRDLLPRGRPWWRAPSFPAEVTLRADLCLPAPSGQARETAEVVATRLRTCLT